MSLTSGPMNEAEQATEKAADHIADHIGQNAPGVAVAMLAALTKYRIKASVTIEVEAK